jgi:hypothetical protein
VLLRALLIPIRPVCVCFRQRALFNVLKAYSVLDKELGYCQSMSFIVAILLLYMPEQVLAIIRAPSLTPESLTTRCVRAPACDYQDAFWVLCQLTKVYHIRGFFQKGLPLLRLSLYQLGTRTRECRLASIANHERRPLVGVQSDSWSSRCRSSITTSRTKV